MKYDVSKIRNPEIRDLLGDYFEDIEKHVYGVSDYAGLVAALADTSRDVIHLTANITLTGQLAIGHAVEIDGNGFSLTDASLDANQYMAAQITAEGVYIHDVTWAISGNSDGNAIYAIDVGAAKSRIENCIFTMANTGSSGAVAVYYEGYANQILSGNTMTNGVAVTGSAVMIEMQRNTFAATKGVGLGVCTIGGVVHTVASTADVAAIKAYLTAEGNVTTGGTLVVEDYL